MPDGHGKRSESNASICNSQAAIESVSRPRERLRTINPNQWKKQGVSHWDFNNYTNNYTNNYRFHAELQQVLNRCSEQLATSVARIVGILS